MSHQRNVEGLRANAQGRHEEALGRVTATLAALNLTGEILTFRRVAQTAGVSISWLYKHPEVKQRIQDLRAQQRQGRSLPLQDALSRRTESSRAAVVVALQQRIKELQEENRALKQQLEVVYGQLRQRPPAR